MEVTRSIDRGGPVLVTGISGFLVGHTAAQLLAHGFHVRGAARDMTRSAGLSAGLSAGARGCWIAPRVRSCTPSETRPNHSLVGASSVHSSHPPFPDHNSSDSTTNRTQHECTHHHH